jgi:hypothetical protein
MPMAGASSPADVNVLISPARSIAVLAYLLLRHEQDPLQDLTHPGQDDQDQAGC